ncbi:DNA-directed RNA polymerase II core subunit [Tilletia horrida]|uniref:DNA-directed RNA polymerase II core subunit n=1 Tax=Tilletia horrida TaxID=155126 RepID=A0AAN6GAD6_9BASI|nr:DNA-directed RNA polymerase II core subunit [Tilletia horrida]KAK0529598.1 DNA-directed RNA polymerase II core subunit [Tilletia horrida]KAK0530017.1 DNA-directed RNA polymerase II core subunit [Tilletia horrida]KAK0559960.1 DNA-directed RNA polymerase II core subunit [Tilletia horrida]
MSQGVNAPNQFELFMLMPGEKRVEIKEDTRIPNTVTVIFNKEDHTLGNLVRHAVLKQPSVLFAGYKVPHPLEPRTLVRIQTDGSKTPIQALRDACQVLITNFADLSRGFAEEIRMWRPAGQAGPGGGPGGMGQAGPGQGGMPGVVGMGQAGMGYGGQGADSVFGQSYAEM